MLFLCLHFQLLFNAMNLVLCCVLTLITNQPNNIAHCLQVRLFFSRHPFCLNGNFESCEISELSRSFDLALSIFSFTLQSDPTPDGLEILNASESTNHLYLPLRFIHV